MKRTMMVAAGILALGAALAAEQIEIKPPAAPKLTKAERTEKVKQALFRAEKLIRDITDERIARMAKQNPKLGEQERKARDAAQAKLPGLRTELAWLEGKLTLAGCEKSVKTLDESLGKAEADDPGRPAIETAIAEARRELEQIKKLEAEKDF